MDRPVGRTCLERRGKRRKQLLDDFKGKTRFWNLKQEALDHTLWRTRFGTGYGPVARQSTWQIGSKHMTSQQAVRTVTTVITGL